MNDDVQTDTPQPRRPQTRKVEKWRAIQRIVGSSILGVGATYKLFTYEPIVHADGEPHGVPWILGVWIGLALIAFGLASWDQILKAIKR